MGAFVSALAGLSNHKGKTVLAVIATVLSLGWSGMEAGIIPRVATENYVNEVKTEMMTQVDVKTKGLDFLVRSALEKDLDAMQYAVECMNQVTQISALRRLEEQYEEFYSEEYRHKSCAQLEQLLRARQGE